MELFFSYIKQHKKEICLGASFFAIFLACFLLYRVPAQAIFYPAVLCAIIGTVVIWLDFRKVRKKHQFLKSMKSDLDILIQTFPEPEGIEEEDYQKLIQILGQCKKEYEQGMNLRYEEMVEYYTIWAHQIKTPIAAMRLTLQNEDSSLSRKLSGDLFRIEQYVEMVLMFLRLDEKTSDYVIKEQDLDVIIRGTVRKFAGEFISRKLKLEYEPLDCNIITDEKWLSFVLEQMLSNALKYTPSGSIFITMETPKILCIRDTGIGIAPEDVPRIFEKGYTGYNGRSDKRASGIGLYLCKRICDNLGHGIRVESVLGQGTTIFLDLNQVKLGIE